MKSTNVTEAWSLENPVPNGSEKFSEQKLLELSKSNKLSNGVTSKPNTDSTLVNENDENMKLSTTVIKVSTFFF